MMDFLKANPALSMDDYLWKLSAPMVRVMSADATVVAYLSEKAYKEYQANQRNAKSKHQGTHDNLNSFFAALGR